MINKMVLELNILKIIRFIKGNIKMDKNKEQESFSGKMVQCILVNLKIMKLMDRGNTYEMTKDVTKDNGKIIK